MDCPGCTCSTQEQKITDTFLLFAPLTLALAAKPPTTPVEKYSSSGPARCSAVFLVIKPDFPLVVAALWYPDEVARPVLNYPEHGSNWWHDAAYFPLLRLKLGLLSQAHPSHLSQRTKARDRRSTTRRHTEVHSRYTQISQSNEQRQQ